MYCECCTARTQIVQCSTMLPLLGIANSPAAEKSMVRGNVPSSLPASLSSAVTSQNGRHNKNSPARRDSRGAASCHYCGATFVKKTAQFCSKCGTRRQLQSLPVVTTPKKAGAPTSTGEAAPSNLPTTSDGRIACTNLLPERAAVTDTIPFLDRTQLMRPDTLHAGHTGEQHNADTHAKAKGNDLGEHETMVHSGRPSRLHSRRQSQWRSADYDPDASEGVPEKKMPSCSSAASACLSHSAGSTHASLENGATSVPRNGHPVTDTSSSTLNPTRQTVKERRPESMTAPCGTPAHMPDSLHTTTDSEGLATSWDGAATSSKKDKLTHDDVSTDENHISRSANSSHATSSSTTTLRDSSGSEVKYHGWATLPPDALSPELLQTSNADELRQWRKGNLIGRGTYGSVYLGLLPDGSFYAVKCVKLGAQKSDRLNLQELVSLSREIHVMQRLRHPNLCDFKGVYYDAADSCMCMFMEYIGGGSLTSIYRKFKPLPTKVIQAWTRQLLTGLLCLHGQNIIHRDVKGDNVLIDLSANPGTAAQVKLVDFGASRRLTDVASQSNTIIGTPYWMAPEVVHSSVPAASIGRPQSDTPDRCNEGSQRNSSAADAENAEQAALSAEAAVVEQTGYSYKADVWSVGCTVSEMVCGRPPWPVCENAAAAIMMIGMAPGAPTKIPTEEATPGCADFMHRCLTYDPAKRPTVEELLQHPWMTGEME